MRIVYMGTPDFAVPSLEALIRTGKHEIAGVFTQPDKPKGRGYAVAFSPVKNCAISYNIPVYQPNTLKDGTALEIIKELQPDVIAVVAYGKILPKEILNYPKHGCVNVHGSLLPKFRGAGPIQWSVLNGEEETGVTTMYMGEGVDTGDMLLKESTKIDENETAGHLYDRIAQMGAELLCKTLDALEKGEIMPEKQDDNLASHAPMLNKKMCPIDWSMPAKEVHNKIRGLNPWPVATAMFGGKRVKIFLSLVSDKKGAAGNVICTKPLTVACGDGAVEILELQMDGKKRMNADDFVRGYRITTEMSFE